MRKFAGYTAHNCPECGSNRVFFKKRQSLTNTAAAYWDHSTVFCGGCNAPATNLTTKGGIRHAQYG